MRKTLRRSCDACAKSKLSCDLRLPQCSRCAKRKTTCVYANQPLTSSPTEETATSSSGTSSEAEVSVVCLSKSPITFPASPGSQSFDPFDSYPQTRLPRAQVQQLIQHFLSNIAFQYYPLDLSTTSNPFVVSWWPLALADPALFHVSLQTASLDVDLRAQKGFKNSEILMADSVSLVRKRVEDPALAFQDETMDSVVTMAAIEFGKGNITLGTMHIEGVKRMVQMRGGMQQVKSTSPLTARMVSWQVVSMILMKSPQFPTQDNLSAGGGIAPIPQWEEAGTSMRDIISPALDDIDLDPAISDILFRLRNLFHEPQRFYLSSTDLHDLACFVLHRLLPQSTPSTLNDILPVPALSDCVRYGLVLYILIIHGSTYFSHAQLQYNATVQLRYHLENLSALLLPKSGPLTLWLLSVGMVASDGTPESDWFMTQFRTAADTSGLSAWDDIQNHLKEILWSHSQQLDYVFRQRWEETWRFTAI
ncbi:Nn.00g042270.m01.CDS01 [Neocucurbitaria sp. VM-36]